MRKRISLALVVAGALFATSGAVTAAAAVTVTNDPTTFSNLFTPDPAQPDEVGLAGFT